MGLFSRRRPPLLRLLPTRQQTHPLPAGARNLRPRSRQHHLRPAVPNQLGRRERALLALRRQQLRRMGHAHPVPARLEGALRAGRVLHRLGQSGDRLRRSRLVGVWVGVVDVSEHGAGSES